jgi:uncharacterized protein
MITAPWRWPGRVAVGFLVLTIRLYQHTLSPLLGPVCRFEPSCSKYMIASLRQYGLFKGLRKGMGRLLRCHARPNSACAPRTNKACQVTPRPHPAALSGLDEHLRACPLR